RLDAGRLRRTKTPPEKSRSVGVDPGIDRGGHPCRLRSRNPPVRRGTYQRDVIERLPLHEDPCFTLSRWAVCHLQRKPHGVVTEGRGEVRAGFGEGTGHGGEYGRTGVLPPSTPPPPLPPGRERR